MGGSNWHYFTPYQPNVEQALQSLRQQEFQKCRTRYRFAEPLISFEEFVFPDLLSEDNFRDYQEEYAFYCQDYAACLKKQYPETIDELLNWLDPNPTNSIMDINRTSDRVADFAAAPLTSSQLLDFFGTLHPSHSMIVDHQREFDAFLVNNFRYPWQATYSIVYLGQIPSEIYFCGCTSE